MYQVIVTIPVDSEEQAGHISDNLQALLRDLPVSYQILEVPQPQETEE